MIERRRNPGLSSLTRWWISIWLMVLVFFGTLLATDAFAQRYGYDRYDGGGYRGWRSDQIEEQRRQTRLMERQEQRELDRELQQSYEQDRRNVQNYNDRLRRGGW